MNIDLKFDKARLQLLIGFIFWKRWFSYTILSLLLLSNHGLFGQNIKISGETVELDIATNKSQVVSPASEHEAKSLVRILSTIAIYDTEKRSVTIKYNISGIPPLLNVRIEAADVNGRILSASNSTGDTGDIEKNGLKIIVWNLDAEGIADNETKIRITVVGDVPQKRDERISENKITSKQGYSGSGLNAWGAGKYSYSYNYNRKDIWINWLYIAAGASAATGIYSHFKAKKLHDEYTLSSATPEAERLHKEVEKFITIRNSAFGAAGVFGSLGVVVQIRHNKKNNGLVVYTNPTISGVNLGLTYNF